MKNIISWWNWLLNFFGFAKPATPAISVAPDEPVEVPPVAPAEVVLSINGNADCPEASILLVAEDGGTTTTTADVNGLFVFEGVQPGTYRVIPSHSGSKFLPPFRTVKITDRDVWVSFVDPTVWSQLDCRDYATFPNSIIVIQATDFYIGQVSCNAHIPPTDSRIHRFVDSRVSYPTNCRVNPLDV